MGKLLAVAISWFLLALLLPTATWAAQGTTEDSTAATGAAEDTAPAEGTDPAGGTGTDPASGTGTDPAGGTGTDPGTGTTPVEGTACDPAVNADCEPPVLQLPAPLTVDAGSPEGAVVQFEVIAVDGVDPAPLVVCTPSSGSVFAVGTSMVTCTATDSSQNFSPPGTFTVTVNAPPVLTPDAPDANDDSVETVQGVALQIAYLTNDVDPSGDATARIEGQPSNGAVETAGGLFTYTPNAQFVGIDQFTYGLCRAQPSAVCDTATVTIRVRPIEGMTATALAEPTWQVMSQRPFEGIPNNCKGALAWGGYANGRIPRESMFSIGSAHVLEREAATQLLAMRAASEQGGIALPLTDSYRSYEAQVEVRARKGGVVATATPGTSVHGWAKAIDINLGASPGLQSWLEQNAVRFGWVNPAWARRPGKSFEPWHYEFYGSTPATGDGGGCRPTTTPATTVTALDSPLAAPATPPASAPQPLPFSPTSFLGQVRTVQGLIGLGALGVAALTARFAVKEFRARRRDE